MISRVEPLRTRSFFLEAHEPAVYDRAEFRPDGNPATDGLWGRDGDAILAAQTTWPAGQGGDRRQPAACCFR